MPCPEAVAHRFAGASRTIQRLRLRPQVCSDAFSPFISAGPAADARRCQPGNRSPDQTPGKLFEYSLAHVAPSCTCVRRRAIPAESIVTRQARGWSRPNETPAIVEALLIGLLERKRAGGTRGGPGSSIDSVAALPVERLARRIERLLPCGSPPVRRLFQTYAIPGRSGRVEPFVPVDW